MTISLANVYLRMKNYTFISKTDITLMDKIQCRRVRASNLSDSLLILQGPDNNHTALQEYYLLNAYNGLSWTAKGCLNTFRLRTEDSRPPTVPWQVAIGIRAQKIHRNCCFTRYSTFDSWEKCDEGLLSHLQQGKYRKIWKSSEVAFSFLQKWQHKA